MKLQKTTIYFCSFIFFIYICKVFVPLHYVHTPKFVFVNIESLI